MEIQFSRTGKLKLAAQSIVTIITSFALIAIFVQNVRSEKTVEEIAISASLAFVSILLLKPGINQLLQVLKKGPAIYIDNEDVVIFGGYGKRKINRKSISSIAVQSNVIEIKIQSGGTIRIPASYYDEKNSSAIDQIENLIKNRFNG